MERKLEEFELMRERLSRESMMGKAIVLIRDFSNGFSDQKTKDSARQKFEDYRVNYHKFSNILKANIKKMKEDCLVTLAELTPLPPFPQPFCLTQALAKEVADRTCVICLNEMMPREQMTKCEICRRHFHAQVIF